MSFILYVVVLVVSLSSVMMGLDWLSTPPPPIPKSVQTASAPAAPKAAGDTAIKTASETVAAAKTPDAKTPDIKAPDIKTAETKTTETRTAARKPAPKAAVATTGAASATAAAQAIAKADATQRPDSADNQGSGASDGTLSVIANEDDGSGADAQANATQPRCDVQVCATHYRSFNPADCTYQPYDGPRRLCTLGNPPQQASDAVTGVQTSDASAPPASASCNVAACAAAYRSFDPATCTYQPFDGPRRACTK